MSFNARTDFLIQKLLEPINHLLYAFKELKGNFVGITILSIQIGSSFRDAFFGYAVNF